MNVGLLAILTAVLVACGSGMRTSDEYVDKSKQGYTQGVNEIGLRYTRFSSDDSMEKIKATLEEDPTNVPRAMLFASDIGRARFLTHSRNEPNPEKYEVEIKWKNRATPQVYQGVANTRNNTLAAILRPVNDGPNLVLELTCFPIAEFACGKALILISDGKKALGGMEFIRQPKVLQTVVNGNQGPLSPKAKIYVDNHKQGQPVIARSYSVVYGSSEVEIVEKTAQGLQTVMRADLLDPEGEGLPVTAVSNELRELGQTTIVGNNTRNLTILQEDRPMRPQGAGPTPVGSRREFVIRLTDAPQRSTGAPAQGHSSCQIAEQKPTSPNAKAIVDEVVSYCDQDKMKDHRNYWSRRSPETVRRLIRTYQEAVGEPKSEVAKRMKIAIAELRAATMPISTLGITLQESGGYNPWAEGSSGERSEWQIMLCTGFGLNIVRIHGTICTKNSRVIYDGRLDSKVATQAMANYLKQFFRTWNYRDPNTNQLRQNYPMALASYNAGPGNTDKASDRAEAKIRTGKTGQVLSYGRLTEAQIRLISSDFFFLARENVGLKPHQIEYTYRVIAGTQIILDPKSHGLPELAPVSGD